MSIASEQEHPSARLRVSSSSPHETKLWGRRLAMMLEGGEVLGLRGELGAGKTCFVKGLARGLRLREEEILSPTFTMVQEHLGRLPLYHIDLYRLDRINLDDLGLRDYLFSGGVSAVEWFERLHEADELDCIVIAIEYDGASCRSLEFIASGERHVRLLEQLRLKFA